MVFENVDQAVEHLRGPVLQGSTVLTSGCFDLLHVGHVRLIQAAAKLDGVLLVGINSDDSVGRLKAGRPFVPFWERAEMVAAIAGVDFVVGFDGGKTNSPIELIRRLRPDFFVKGCDVPDDEAAAVRQQAGIPLSFGLLAKSSSTDLVKRIRSSAGGGG